MRLKNVKGAKETIEASPYLVLEPNQYKGKWNQVFKNQFPIHVEIGMGKGDFLIGNAKEYPDINFIGIEKYDSVLVHAIRKLEDTTLPNLRIIRIDATYIEDSFQEEIDTIYLNFSDPWPKNRHEHRRLSSPLFLKRYDHVLKTKKQLIMKTDNRKLFEYSVISFTEYGYHIDEISLHLHEDNVKNNIETEYEKKFVKKGFPIYKIAVTK